MGKRYTAGSLFSGIGGIDYAFAVAGFNILFQVELDPFCRRVLKHHAPAYWNSATMHEDVKHVGRHNLASVDVLFGGFPCQDISISGKRAGVLVGTRSGLWFEFARIIGELRPQVVFLENVKDIVSLGGTTVVGGLTEMGYDALWLPVRASQMGAPHARERWFCIAWDVSNTNRQRRIQPSADERLYDFDGNGSEAQPAGDEQLHALVGSAEAVGDAHSFSLQTQRQRGKQVQPVRQGLRTPQRADRRGDTNSDQSRMGVFADGLSRRLVEHQFPAFMGQPQHNFEPPRTLPKTTPHWEDQVRALGNAVVPQVIYPFACAINEWLDKGVRHA